MQTCAVPGCSRPINAKGLCDTHGRRLRAHGDVMADVPIRDRRTPNPGAMCLVEGCKRAAKARGWCANHYAIWRRTGSTDKTRVRGRCSIEGCENPHKCHGYCIGHYARWRTHGDAMDRSPLRPMHPPGICSVDGCERKSRNKGMCGMHFARVKTHGDPEKVSRIDKYPVGAKRHLSDGYVVVKAPGHPNAARGGWVREHIAVMAEVLGRPIRKGETVHHRNGIRDDNRPENLQLMAYRLHPAGQSVEDLVAFAREVLALYGP